MAGSAQSGGIWVFVGNQPPGKRVLLQQGSNNSQLYQRADSNRGIKPLGSSFGFLPFIALCFHPFTALYEFFSIARDPSNVVRALFLSNPREVTPLRKLPTCEYTQLRKARIGLLKVWN